MSADLRVQDGGGLRHIVLDRPAKANALSIDMVRAAEQAFLAPVSSEIHAFLVSGVGEKGFCAGGDLGELRSGQRAEQYAAMCDLIRAIAGRTLPLLTVVHGKTLGAACIFSTLSDVVLAAEDTVIGVPEMHFGMYPALVHSLLLECLPSSLVYQICLGARSLSAAEAFALGLVTEILPMESFRHQSDARITHYLERIDAIRAGRELRRLEKGLGLHARSLKAEALVIANLEAPTVQHLLASWLR